MSKTQVTKPQDPQLPVALDFAADAGAGMEGADAASFAIPFLAALQKISPQCDEADGKFIEGAKGGMLFNSVSSRLWDGKTGVVILPVAFQRRFLRWGPRAGEGAGFKGELMPAEVAAMQDDGRLRELDGRWYFPAEDGTVSDKKCDRVADVRNHFCLIIDEVTGAATRALMSLGSTQIKKSKMLMSMLSEVKVRGPNGALVTPPTWANRVRVTTVPESNDKGSWYGVRFELEGFVEDPAQYAEGRAFHAAIAAGTAGNVNYAEADPTAAAPAEGDKF